MNKIMIIFLIVVYTILMALMIMQAISSRKIDKQIMANNKKWEEYLDKQIQKLDEKEENNEN